MSALNRSFLKNYADKDFRDSFVESRVRNLVAYQVKALRDQRGWTQSDLAKRLGKPQSIISRLEDPEYGRLTLSTIISLARVFDVGLLVKLCTHEKFISETKDVTPKNLEVAPFSEDRFNSYFEKSQTAQIQDTQDRGFYAQVITKQNAISFTSIQTPLANQFVPRAIFHQRAGHG